MKKAVLPAYILLVAGWLTCLLMDCHLTSSLVTPYFSFLPVAATMRVSGSNGKLVIVSPGGITKIYYRTCLVRGHIFSGNTILICACPNINQTGLLVKGD